ncbi:MAG: hypothetical protein ABIX28_16530 [Vicinamibacterales bacterium]
MAATNAPAPTPRAAETAPAALPTTRTVFMRTFVPWQVVRFAVINLKMIRLIWQSH